MDNTSLAVPGALANRLQRRTARKANEANLDIPNKKSKITSREKKWKKKWKMENNDENSGPLMSLPVDRLTATDCNAAARANLNPNIFMCH